MAQAAAGGAERQVPGELVGTWHYNWVSGVNQQDPTTGHWLPPTAFDITFVFTDEVCRVVLAGKLLEPPWFAPTGRSQLAWQAIAEMGDGGDSVDETAAGVPRA